MNPTIAMDEILLDDALLFILFADDLALSKENQQQSKLLSRHRTWPDVA